MGLETYQKKRKFNATPEPKGEIAKRRESRFVVQKHAATHLHYDFRLESGGVLKSWAVPKGPPLDPKDKRLAVMVEDHPIEYQKFEGVIPEGNYGAGTVEIWDKGHYFTLNVNKERQEKTVEEGLKQGHLDLILEGEKLKGEYTLVKTKLSEKSWLLIKKEDPYLAVEMPKQVKPMLATLVGEPFDKDSWLFEMKIDGYRAIAEVNGAEVNLYSRNFNSFNNQYPQIVDSLRNLGKVAVLDGEIAVVDNEGKPSFQLLQNYPREQTGNLIYFIFDLLYLNKRDLQALPLTERKNILRQNLPPSPFLKFTDHIEKNGTAFFNAAKEKGLEGIMAKDGKSPYRQGKRTKEWLKIKTTRVQEAVIGGFTQPKGKRGYFGALILGVYEGNNLVYVGHTGSGFEEKSLEETFEKLKRKISPVSPFKNPPKPNAPVTWLRPEMACEVKYQEWTKDGHLRMPIFLRMREDKPPKEIGREKILSTKEILKGKK